MAKEKEIITEDSLFKNFNLLDNPVPKEITKSDDSGIESPTNDVDELTPEELAAVEATAKEIASSKDKTKEEIPDKEEDKEDDIPVDDGNEFNAFAQFLAEQGLAKIDEGEEIKTDDDLAKVWKKSVTEGIDSYKSSKPEDVQKFLEFVDNGGNPSDFHKYYYGEGGSFEDFDITETENQKYVITEALKLEDFTEEEIADELTNLEDLETLDKKAGIYLRKLKKVEKEQKELLLEAQKSYAKEQEAIRTTEWETFKKGLFEKETIGGFKITPKVKNELWDYMTKPVNKKIGKTQYQIDSEENNDSRYMFAYLLKNKWDIKALEKQVETKEVSKLRGKLARYSDTNIKRVSIKNDKRTEDSSENPFEAFKKVLG